MIDIGASNNNNNHLIVECKAYRKPVGLGTAREFARTVNFLREEEPNLEAWLVTTSGFTQGAQKALIRSSIKGFTLSDLFSKLGKTSDKLVAENAKWDTQIQKSRSSQIRVFVLMPFCDDMLDVFILGVRWVTDKLDMVAERSDDIDHNGEIIEHILSSIRDYDIIIADTSGSNPNVCYEVGYAHGIKKNCVLICKKGNKLPFDLQGANHLMYKNVIDLRTQLEKKLTQLRNQILNNDGKS